MIQLPNAFFITEPFIYPEKPDDLGHKHRLEYKRTSRNGFTLNGEPDDRPVYWFLCIRCRIFRMIHKSLFWAES